MFAPTGKEVQSPRLSASKLMQTILVPNVLNLFSASYLSFWTLTITYVYVL